MIVAGFVLHLARRLVECGLAVGGDREHGIRFSWERVAQPTTAQLDDARAFHVGDGERAGEQLDCVASVEVDVAAGPTDETLPPFIDAIVALLSRHSGGQWSGKCGELLGELGRNGRATAEGKWPRTPQQLGIALRRHKEDLERLDVELVFRREGKLSARVVTLRRRVLSLGDRGVSPFTGQAPSG